MPTSDRRNLFSTPVNSPYTQAHKKYKLLFFLANFIGSISIIATVYSFYFPQQPIVFWMNSTIIHHYSMLIANNIGFEKAKYAILPFIVFLVAECVLIFTILQLVNITKAINQEHNNHED